ncbi:MFS transporter [Gulosibacter chungangensis]|uniref:MHS family MFS transporter n=1 Tax=Gulosibacter chungangensis TaxID=979746 RepID=A0A7J5B9D7_9MICO|nr:MFS transporter [Gulosibacter chungangensis]KAB1641176.1 MHS family MFS transporter [Gulosibacter chungangensis]
MTTEAKPQLTAAQRRRVAGATIIGTTVEWYDFFIYANAAGLVFSQLFFEPVGGTLGQIITFLTVGISFLFRPLGAALVGHYGDKLGRKLMLVITLVLMGAATTLIGLLPTYDSIGVWAPILLILLRVLQGISAGGEWGGAVLMAVEYAPVNNRGRYGMYPQLGVPLGMLLATAVLALMSGVISPGDAFNEWGWRVPFLLSIVLVVVGFVVRQSVDESPVFQEIQAAGKQTKMPMLELFKKHWKLVVLLALVFAGNNASGYMITGGFLLNYSTDPAGSLAMDRTAVLNSVTIASVIWLLATLFAGYLSDWIGRKNTYVFGWLWMILTVFPLFWLVDTGSVLWLTAGMCIFSVGLGLTYGPQAAWYAETFPASVRTSGVSISYALGAIVGGAFAPTIAAALVGAFHTTLAVSFYLLVVIVLGLSATLVLRDRRGIPLDIEFEESGRYELFDPDRRPTETRAIMLEYHGTEDAPGTRHIK